MCISEKSVKVTFSAHSRNAVGLCTGLKASWDGVLREKAVWVEDSD